MPDGASNGEQCRWDQASESVGLREPCGSCWTRKELANISKRRRIQLPSLDGLLSLTVCVMFRPVSCIIFWIVLISGASRPFLASNQGNGSLMLVMHSIADPRSSCQMNLAKLGAVKCMVSIGGYQLRRRNTTGWPSSGAYLYPCQNWKDKNDNTTASQLATPLALSFMNSTYLIRVSS